MIGSHDCNIKTTHSHVPIVLNVDSMNPTAKGCEEEDDLEQGDEFPNLK